MTENHTIAATNLGPITDIEFALQSPGVTVLVAPNGSGKTILLDAVQAAARGEGKLPLRDKTRKGKVEAFGAVITLGANCRHSPPGSFEVTNLEGKFDLAQLVDPRLKSPAAADRARIKALVSLTGVAASPLLFRSAPLFEEFDSVVTAQALETDDLIEMAAKIKACYDDEALKMERRSEREFGQATALIPGSDIDLTEECDAEVLQTAYNEARDEVIRLEEQAKNAGKAREQLSKAERVISDIGEEELVQERSDLLEWLENVDGEVEEKNREIQALLAEVERKRGEVKQIQSKAVDSRARIATVDRLLALVDEAKKVLSDRTLIAVPEEQDIIDAKEALVAASDAMFQGGKIRDAKENAKKVALHRAAAKDAQDKAGKYRDAGKATDEVLSGCIRCPQVRVESDGKSARLVTDHTIRGASIPYHDLSDGEKWTIAIDIGADQVGEGGLLVISQIGWEGIDGANRLAIHEHAVKRGVYILTAEAASDPTAMRVIKPMRLEWAAKEQIRGNLVAAELAEQKRKQQNIETEKELLQRSIDECKENQKVLEELHPAKEPEKPVEKPAAPPKPAKKPPAKLAPRVMDLPDDEDIPF